MDPTAQEFQTRTFSIKLWPPSASTRAKLVDKMTKNLSSETIFSKKYGLLSEEDAYENAKRIEDECFIAASEHFQNEPDGDGSSAVQFYAKQTSKLMLEVLKRGPKAKDGEVTAVSGLAKTIETLFDISSGKRTFIEAEEARELLRPLTLQGNSYSKICFSNRSFSVEAAHVAAPILASLKEQLTEVNLSDFVAGRPEDDALEVMKIFSSALEGTVLRYLNLMNDGISEEAAKAVCELIPSTDKLTILHFHNNMTGDEGAIAISELLKRSPLLEDFRCSSTRVGSDGGIELAKALETLAISIWRTRELLPLLMH